MITVPKPHIRATGAPRPSTAPRRRPRARLALLAAALIVALSGPSAHAGVSPPKLGPDHRVRLLTGPSSADPLDIATGYLTSHAADLALTAADVSTLQLAHRYTTEG